MLAVVEKLRLSGLYQTLLAPAMDAREARVAIRPAKVTFQRSTGASVTGDNGPGSLYPFWGTFKTIDHFRRNTPPAR